MTAIPARAPARVLRGRGIGAMVGACMGAGWWFWAFPGLTALQQIVLGALGLAVAGGLLAGSLRLLATARRLPAPDATARASNRRIWTGFWINLVLEIVLLNVAVSLLDAPALHVYWRPAISLVVGLHFLPLAVIFPVASFWGCGAAMTALAVVTGAVIHGDPSLAASLVTAESLGNALILWATAGWGIFRSRSA